jgi:predicted DNA-binding protein with PD1-like motif
MTNLLKTTTKSLISSTRTRHGFHRTWFSLLVVLFIASGYAMAGDDAQIDQAPDQYVAPGPVTARGLAPRMKYKDLGQQATTYAVIFGSGDEVASGLTEFAEKNHIQSGHLTAIGAFSGAVLAYFDRDRKEYKKITINSQVEVLSFIGDFALDKGKPVLHAHVVVGFPDGHTMGGHLLEAHVWPTLEVFLVASPTALHKQLDPDSHLDLIVP